MAQDDGKSSGPENLSSEDLAYIAGFFDGEGSITIHHNAGLSPRSINPNHTLQVSVGNTDPTIVVWLHTQFGGNLTHRKPPKENHRSVTQWNARANLALAFLERVRPFLRMKGPQADLGITFQKAKGHYRKKELSAEEVARREEQRAAIRTLNGRANLHRSQLPARRPNPRRAAVLNAI